LSRTRKDSARSKTKHTILELVKRTDGNFDLFLNGMLDHGEIEEKWLPEDICVRFGFCGEEYDAILREANESGKARLVF
jgi:hypothetical protein